MMARERHQLAAELLRQDLSRLYVPRLSLQSPFSNRYEHPDLVFLDQLDIRKVVGDGQQLQFHQDTGGNLIVDAVFTTLLPAAFGILVRPDLSPGKFADREFSHQVQSWQEHRNQRVGAVNWQFRTADARIKLKRLYPVQQPDSQPSGHIVDNLT